MELFGYGVFFKLLEVIYGHEGYYINWGEKELYLFSKRIGADAEEVKKIVDDCIEEGLFDEKILTEYKVLTSASIQKRFLEAARKRKNKELRKELNLIEKSHSAPETPVSAPDKDKEAEEIPQSKVKESKVKESKVIEVEEESKIEIFKNQLLKDQEAIETIRDEYQVEEDDFKNLLEIFLNQKKLLKREHWEDYEKFKENFYYWIPKKLEKNATNFGNSNKKNGGDKRGIEVEDAEESSRDRSKRLAEEAAAKLGKFIDSQSAISSE